MLSIKTHALQRPLVYHKPTFILQPLFIYLSIKTHASQHPLVYHKPTLILQPLFIYLT